MKLFQMAIEPQNYTMERAEPRDYEMEGERHAFTSLCLCVYLFLGPFPLSPSLAGDLSTT